MQAEGFGIGKYTYANAETAFLVVIQSASGKVGEKSSIC